MKAIKGQDTKPEMMVRRLLHKEGFRYRLHCPNLPGKPDIVLPRFKTAIFVHGCFWHVHMCDLFKWPRSRPEWWKEKLEKNRERDRMNQRLLVDAGWKVM